MIESDKRKGWELLKVTVYPPSIYKNDKTEYFTAAVIRKGFMAAVFLCGDYIQSWNVRCGTCVDLTVYERMRCRSTVW